MPAAVNDLTTVANVKASMPNFSGTDADPLLQRYVTAASAFFQQRTGRDLIQQSYPGEVRDGTGTARLVLAQYPVVSVASVTEDGLPVLPRAQMGDGGWVLKKPSGFGLVNGMGSLVRDGAKWSRAGLMNVTIAYTAGWIGPGQNLGASQIPSELEQAIIEMVVLKFRERDRIGQKSLTIAVAGGHETTVFSDTDLTPYGKTILSEYSTRVPL